MSCLLEVEHQLFQQRMYFLQQVGWLNLRQSMTVSPSSQPPLQSATLSDCVHEPQHVMVT